MVSGDLVRIFAQIFVECQSVRVLGEYVPVRVVIECKTLAESDVVLAYQTIQGVVSVARREAVVLLNIDDVSFDGIFYSYNRQSNLSASNPMKSPFFKSSDNSSVSMINLPILTNADSLSIISACK